MRVGPQALASHESSQRNILILPVRVPSGSEGTLELAIQAEFNKMKVRLGFIETIKR